MYNMWIVVHVHVLFVWEGRYGCMFVWLSEFVCGGYSKCLTWIMCLMCELSICVCACVHGNKYITCNSFCVCSLIYSVTLSLFFYFILSHQPIVNTNLIVSEVTELVYRYKLYWSCTSNIIICVFVWCYLISFQFVILVHVLYIWWYCSHCVVHWSSLCHIIPSSFPPPLVLSPLIV